MVLYESAFAVIVARFDAQARANALLAVTIVAGFASSIFLPLTGLLVEKYGWRQALVVGTVALAQVARYGWVMAAVAVACALAAGALLAYHRI
ncbi:hypothetical protein [Acrocarpospora catenulata]|uniref:hypothetical protein n=1 Tax=Acrocarpospora catenulata TaxID=2836182 RepID=UPI002023A7AF|nr:hypothetical protein [Acrocarpospora catenulata]